MAGGDGALRPESEGFPTVSMPLRAKGCAFRTMQTIARLYGFASWFSWFSWRCKCPGRVFEGYVKYHCDIVLYQAGKTGVGG